MKIADEIDARGTLEGYDEIRSRSAAFRSTGDASTNCSDSRNRPVTIVKIEKRTHPFAMIDARALNDERISWKAKGLHAYLMSKPKDWRVIFSDLVKHATDGGPTVCGQH